VSLLVTKLLGTRAANFTVASTGAQNVYATCTPAPGSYVSHDSSRVCPSFSIHISIPRVRCFKGQYDMLKHNTLRLH
jgi:hypothetical protein